MVCALAQNGPLRLPRICGVGLIDGTCAKTQSSASATERRFCWTVRCSIFMALSRERHLEDEHGVAVAVETILVRDRFGIGSFQEFRPREGGDQQQQRRSR